MKKALFHLCKIVGVCWAVWLLWRTLTRDGLDWTTALHNLRWGYLFLAFCIYGGVQLLGAWRWGIFLSLQGTQTGFWARLRVILYTGALNLMIWGGVGGDVLRVMLLFPGQPAERRLPLAMTVVLDRFMGVASLCIIASLTLLGLRFSPTTSHLFLENHSFLLLLYGVCGFTAFLLLLMVVTRFLKEDNSAASDVEGGVLLRQWRKFREVMANLWRHPCGSLHALALSFLIHLLLGCAYCCLGRGFGEENISLFQYIALAQLSNATAAIPLTPGGIGLRDFVAYLFLTVFQAQPASVCNLIPIAYTVILLLWGIASILFLRMDTKLAQNDQ